MNRFRSLAALTTLTMVLGAAPALAGEGNGTGSPVATILIEELGMTADEIDGLLAAGLGYGEIYVLQKAAVLFATTATALLALVPTDPNTGEYLVSWGHLKSELDARLGKLVSAQRKAGSHS